MAEECSRPGTIHAEPAAQVGVAAEIIAPQFIPRKRSRADSQPEIETEIPGGPADQRREMEKSESEFEARSKAARFAVANTVIEGGNVLPETEELMNEWARGEIDDDELIEQGLKRFGPDA